MAHNIAETQYNCRVRLGSKNIATERTSAATNTKIKLTDITFLGCSGLPQCPNDTRAIIAIIIPPIATTVSTCNAVQKLLNTPKQYSAIKTKPIDINQ